MSTDRGNNDEVASRRPNGKKTRILAVVLLLLTITLPVSRNAAEATEKIIKANGISFTVMVGGIVYLEDIDGERHRLEVIGLDRDEFLHIEFQRFYTPWESGDVVQIPNKDCEVELMVVMSSSIMKGGHFQFLCEVPANDAMLPPNKPDGMAPANDAALPPSKWDEILREVGVGILVAMLVAAAGYLCRLTYKWWTARRAGPGPDARKRPCLVPC